MKKCLLFFIGCTMVCRITNGATVCAKTDTYVDYLKKSVNGTSGEINNSIKAWKIVFNYKTITGIAACNEISGTYGVAQTNLYTTYTDVGQYCWCKMEPVETYGYETGFASHWVFLDTYTDASTCASSCTMACKDAIMSNLTFRSAVFEAIW